MEKLKKLQRLMNAANAIEGSIDQWENNYTKDTRCDKHGFGFNNDYRFAACEPLKLTVDSWKGYYGDSGCSNILSVDAAIFNEHLLKVLRSRFWELLKATRESIVAEAATLKDEAKQELADQIKSIDAIKAI